MGRFVELTLPACIMDYWATQDIEISLCRYFSRDIFAILSVFSHLIPLLYPAK
jgi:hypothetical protein